MTHKKKNPVKISYLPGFEPPPKPAKQQKPKPRKQWTKKPKYRTFADGFAAAAEDEQRKIDMQNKAAQALRPKDPPDGGDT